MDYLKEFPKFLKGHGIINFTANECCPVGRTHGGVRLLAPPCDIWSRIIPTLKIAEWARNKLGDKSMGVNSGYRDILYNRAVGSNDASQHVRFTALDLVPPKGVTPRQLYELLLTHPDANKLGIGLYRTFVHIDTRGTAARWAK
jgi:hypothetical protein